MLRGEVWIAVWPNDPTKKPRPVLIVSNDYRNEALFLPDVVVVKLTSLFRDNGSKKPTHPAEDVVATFKKETIIRCASLYSVEKKILQRSVFKIPAPLMQEVDSRLKQVLGLR